VEPPSTRPWLGVGAALSALPAAGGCLCAALVLAVIANSDPGAVYEQHRWLGAIVAASAVFAFVAMMGWATLRHGGLPLPVLLMALVLVGLPFLLPRAVFLPAAALAVAGCAVLAATGLAHPPASPDPTRFTILGLAGAAFVLAIGQAVAVGVVGTPPRAEVLADAPHAARAGKPPARVKAHHPQAASPAHPTAASPARAKATSPADRGASPAHPKGLSAPKGSGAAPSPAPSPTPSPAPTMGGPSVVEGAPVVPPSAGAAPRMPAPADAPGTPAPDAPAPPATVLAAARNFVRDYYAALDARKFAVAWHMLSPEVQSRFGSFAGWKQGYASTTSHTPGGVTVTPLGAGATVGLTLRAGDRGACGKTVERRFAVTWRLARTDAGWRATAASARKLSGPEPC
jgi:hypothetical protein